MPKSIKSILRRATGRNGKSIRRKKNSRKQKSRFKSSNKRTPQPQPHKPQSATNSFKLQLKNLRRKQINRPLLKSKQVKLRKEKQRQRRHEIDRNRKPKTIEYLKAKKAGNPRQVKGKKSQLAILPISYYKQQEPNEEEVPFRDSYFAAKINSISSINRSLEMQTLKDKLGPLSASLPHVLLHKKKIFDLIIDFINEEAHKHILRDAVGLLIQLAKDIRQEFMPFVDDLLVFLVEMFEWRETNLINLRIVFTAFSWLFKYLQKYMEMDDIKRYYKRHFMRFLGNNKYYVRDFMAEVCGNIFKSNLLLAEGGEKEKILILRNDILSVNVRQYLYDNDLLRDTSQTRRNLQIGLSIFLFQLIRGILKGFHSKTAVMLPLMLRVLKRDRTVVNKREKEERQHQMSVFRQFIDLSAVYTNNAHCLTFFAPFFSTLRQHLSSMQKENELMSIDEDANAFLSDLDYLNRLLSLFNVWISHNVGEVVPVAAGQNLIALLIALTDEKWINSINTKDAAPELYVYIRAVMEVIVSCWKMHKFQSIVRFRKVSQNGIKILLDHCHSDTKMIRFIIDRLGATNILDTQMRKYLIRWIEKWGDSHDNNQAMWIFLKLMRKNDKGFHLGEDSHIIHKVKQVMAVPVRGGRSKENDAKMNELWKYNVGNVWKISLGQSRQIQQYLPMIRHFPDKLEWIEGIYNLVNVLLNFIIARDRQKAHIEDYRLTFLNKLHNVLIQLLMAYLMQHNVHDIALPHILNNLQTHWNKWFTLIQRHRYNSFILNASLNFMEFIHSFHAFLNTESQTKVTGNMIAVKDTVDRILNMDTFTVYYPLLLPHLHSANASNRRHAIDILCLFNAETRFNNIDYYGSKILRKPILQELKDILHDDWGPSLDRVRETKVMNIISFASGIEPLLYYKQDIKIQSKEDGIRLGKRPCLHTQQSSAANKYNAEINDYQLQIVCHVVFGFLRINYRPLWSHSIELLNVLSTRFPRMLWTVYHQILRDLMRITHIRRDIAEKLSVRQSLLVNRNKFAASRPLQVLNFLFEHINKNAVFAAMHIKDIVTMFLAFMDSQYHLAYPHSAAAGNYGLIMDEDADDAANKKRIKKYDWSKKDECYTNTSKVRVLSKLRNFLGLFSSVSVDYHGTFAEAVVVNLRDTFYRLLLLRELDIQNMTLAAYVRFYPQIAQYYSNELRKEAKAILDKKGIRMKAVKSRKRHYSASFRSLLKLTRLKAGLVNFNMIKGDIGCVVNDEHRVYVVPVVIRILYNKLYERQARKIKGTVPQRRKRILTYISLLEKHEIFAFLDILHHNFASWKHTDESCSRSAPGFAAQVQHLRIIALWLQCAPMTMGPFLDEFCKYLTLIFKHSYKFLTCAHYRKARSFTAVEQDKCTRNFNMCLDILQKFVEFYCESVGVRMVLKDWMSYIKDYLQSQLPEIQHGNAYENVVAIWSLLKSVSHNEECCNFFDLRWPFELVLRCLNSAKLSKFTRGASLKIIMNLMDNQETMRPLFIRHGKGILHCMLRLLLIQQQNELKTETEMSAKSKRKQNPNTELKILVYLADIIEDKTQLQRLTDSLMPYLIKCKRYSRIIISLLEVLTKLMKQVANYQTWAQPLCDILNSVYDKVGRSLLCQLLANISKLAVKESKSGDRENTVRWLQLVAPLLLDLNCVYIEEITGNPVPFALRRLRAYDYLHSDLMPQLNFHQLKLITSTILFDIGHTQKYSSLELASIGALKSIVEYDYVNHKHLKPSDLATLIDTFINDFILQSINQSEYRPKFFPLLAVICESRPNLNGNLHLLLTDEAVVRGEDFFSLTASGKRSDQIRAMFLLRTFLKPKSEGMQTSNINDRAIVILLPIITAFVYMDGDLGEELRAEAMNVIGSMAECACWIVYRWMIDKFMTDYQNDEKKKLINYKIIALECVMRIAKRFHFEVDVDCEEHLVRLDQVLSLRENKENIWDAIDKIDKNEENESNESDPEDIDMEQKNTDKIDPKSAESDDEKEEVEKHSDDEYEEDLLEEEIFTSSDDPVDIQIFMYDNILKPLMEELSGKHKVIQSEHVHLLSRVARTVVYVAKHLPQSDFDEVFLAAVTTSCQFLVSKIPARRVKARKILCDIMICVGSKFFRYIVKEIESRTVWGRWKHILGFTICDMLSKMNGSKIIEVGSLDHCTIAMSNILLHDIAGAIGAEKILKKRSYRGKEAADSRACEGFEIMAKYVTFNPHIHLMLQPIIKFAKRTTMKTDWRLAKIEQVFAAIKSGLIGNKSVNIDDLIAFTYRTITEQIEILNEGKHVFGEENVNRLTQPSELRRPKMANTPFLLAAPNRVCLVSSTSEPKPSAIIVTKFCLELILLIFQHSPWTRTVSKYNLKQLELIPNLCLKVFNQCPSEEIHIYVLQIAIKLLPYKLSTYSAFADVVIEYSLEAVTRTNLKIKDCALLLLSTMIEHKQLVLDNNMLDVILNYIRQHVLSHICPIGAIHLLHSILDRKLISPKIYDLMFEIHDNLSKLQSEKLTRHYSECLTKFLLSYPLSDGGIKKHFEKIIGSLQHPFVLGRLCSLQLMDEIILKFPGKVIDVYGLVLFISLVQQLANENDKSIKKKIKGTLIILLNKIENDQFWQFWTMFEEWIKQKKKFKLTLASLQCGISFICQSEHVVTKANYKSLCKILLNNGINDAVKQHKSSIKVQDYGENTIWKPCYLSLVLVQHLFNGMQRDYLRILLKDELYKNAFNSTIILMDFPHRWIRTVCCKILGFYLSIVGKEGLIKNNSKKDEGNSKLWIGCDEDSIYNLCEKLCEIMRDLYVSHSLCDQVVKNLLFLTLILHEKYLNGLKGDINYEFIKEMKQRQKETYQRKMREREMSREELKLMRIKLKQSRKREIAEMRKEKAEWFEGIEYEKENENEFVFESEEENENNEENKEGNESNLWIRQKIENKTDESEDKKSPNWRINAIFEFMTERIKYRSTTLDIQYSILEWFAAIIIKFSPYDLRLYDYYILTAVVYMLKERDDPSIAIERRKQFCLIEGRDVEPINLRQQHRIAMYTKCVEISNQILSQLKDKIGDSTFLKKFYEIQHKKSNMRRARKAKANEIAIKKRKLENKSNNNQQRQPAKKKRKTNKDDDWVSFLWS